VDLAREEARWGIDGRFWGRNRGGFGFLALRLRPRVWKVAELEESSGGGSNKGGAEREGSMYDECSAVLQEGSEAL
jgi:hypothetical protein